MRVLPQECGEFIKKKKKVKREILTTMRMGHLLKLR